MVQFHELNIPGSPVRASSWPETQVFFARELRAVRDSTTVEADFPLAASHLKWRQISNIRQKSDKNQTASWSEHWSSGDSWCDSFRTFASLVMQVQAIQAEVVSSLMRSVTHRGWRFWWHVDIIGFPWHVSLVHQSFCRDFHICMILNLLLTFWNVWATLQFQFQCNSENAATREQWER